MGENAAGQRFIPEGDGLAQADLMVAGIVPPAEIAHTPVELGKAQQQGRGHLCPAEDGQHHLKLYAALRRALHCDGEVKVGGVEAQGWDEKDRIAVDFSRDIVVFAAVQLPLNLGLHPA